MKNSLLTSEEVRHNLIGSCKQCKYIKRNREKQDFKKADLRNTFNTKQGKTDFWEQCLFSSHRFFFFWHRNLKAWRHDQMRCKKVEYCKHSRRGEWVTLNSLFFDAVMEEVWIITPNGNSKRPKCWIMQVKKGEFVGGAICVWLYTTLYHSYTTLYHSIALAAFPLQGRTVLSTEVNRSDGFSTWTWPVKKRAGSNVGWGW